MMNKTKICRNPKCKQPEKSISEFYKNNNYDDGLDSLCKDCKKEYYENNKDSILETGKIYYENNKNFISIKGKLWRKNNQTKYLERNKKYREEHPEVLLKWLINNPNYQKELREKRMNNSDYTIKESFLTVDYIECNNCSNKETYNNIINNWIIINNELCCLECQ